MDAVRAVEAVGSVLGRPAASASRHVLLAMSAATATLPLVKTFKPTAAGLPGSHTLLRLVDGLGSWALILSLAGLVIGAALWALGAHSQNYQQSYVGRRAVLVAGAAALVIGAAPTIIAFFFGAGLHFSSPSVSGTLGGSALLR